MPVPTDITAGTISISGSTVTGVGTSFEASDIRQGDLFIWIEGGAGQWSPIVQTVTSNTVLTLAEPWTGPTISGARYRLRYQWDSSRVSAQSRQLIEMLDNGNVLALAGLTGPGVPVFDGPHSMTIRPEADFINGVAYDVQVDTLADRTAYDGQAAGFSVLVSDVGDGRSAVYSKASNTSGDWTDPAYVTGATGAGGPYTEITFGPVITVPSTTPASADVVQVDPDTIRVDLSIPRGTDGTGTVTSLVAGDGITIDSTDPTQPIISATSNSSPGSTVDSLAILSSKSSGSALYLPDGWVDGFSGNDGINSLQSSGYTLDPTFKVVQVGQPSVSSSPIPGATGTAIGANLGDSQPLTVLFNGVTSKTSLNSCFGPAGTANAYAGKDYGSGAGHRIVSALVYGPTDNGFFSSGNPAMTLQLYGKASSPAPSSGTDGVLLGSLSFTDTADESAGRTLVSSDTTTSYRYVWVRSVNNGATVGSRPCFSAMIFNEPTDGPAEDGIIQSTTKQSDFIPSIVSVVHEIEPVDTLTLGTDVIVEVSRNAGVNFSSSVPVQLHTLGTLRQIKTEVDVSGQPSGSSICTKISFVNDKRAKLSGTYETWTE